MRTLLVTCVDAGIRGAVEELEEQLGIAGCDRLQVPGGPLSLVAEGSPRQAVVAWVELLARFKDVGAVHLLSHQHCLAYERNLGGFFYDERQVLERDLLTARRTIENAVYGLRVECHFLPWIHDEAGGAYAAAEPVSLGAA